jgi:DNA-binding transcriptional LysR family regulator
MRKRMPSTMALRLEVLERDTLAVMSGQGAGTLELAAGDLMIPCNRSFVSRRAYYLIVPERKAERQALAVFRQWLVEEAGRSHEAVRDAAVAGGEGQC